MYSLSSGVVTRMGAGMVGVAVAEGKINGPCMKDKDNINVNVG